MTHPTRQEAAEVHEPGVFIEYDQAKMPKPLGDWIGVKLYGPDGELMGLAYVPASHDDRLLQTSAWAYQHARAVIGGEASPPPLRVERGGLR